MNNYMSHAVKYSHPLNTLSIKSVNIVLTLYSRGVNVPLLDKIVKKKTLDIQLLKAGFPWIRKTSLFLGYILNKVVHEHSLLSGNDRQKGRLSHQNAFGRFLIFCISGISGFAVQTSRCIDRVLCHNFLGNRNFLQLVRIYLDTIFYVFCFHPYPYNFLLQKYGKNDNRGILC